MPHNSLAPPPTAARNRYHKLNFPNEHPNTDLDDRLAERAPPPAGRPPTPPSAGVGKRQRRPSAAARAASEAHDDGATRATKCRRRSLLGRSCLPGARSLPRPDKAHEEEEAEEREAGAAAGSSRAPRTEAGATEGSKRARRLEAGAAAQPKQAIEQLDAASGGVLARWGSQADAERGLGLSPTTVGHALRSGREYTTGGSRWRYADGRDGLVCRLVAAAPPAAAEGGGGEAAPRLTFVWGPSPAAPRRAALHAASDEVTTDRAFCV